MCIPRKPLTSRKLSLNTTGLYDSQYPYLTMRGSECNFVQAKASPIVFTDLKDNRLTFGGSLSIPFQPQLLSIPGLCLLLLTHFQDLKEFRLFHSISLPLGQGMTIETLFSDREERLRYLVSFSGLWLTSWWKILKLDLMIQ